MRVRKSLFRPSRSSKSHREIGKSGRRVRSRFPGPLAGSVEGILCKIIVYPVAAGWVLSATPFDRSLPEACTGSVARKRTSTTWLLIIKRSKSRRPCVIATMRAQSRNFAASRLRCCLKLSLLEFFRDTKVQHQVDRHEKG